MTLILGIPAVWLAIAAAIGFVVGMSYAYVTRSGDEKSEVVGV